MNANITNIKLNAKLISFDYPFASNHIKCTQRSKSDEWHSNTMVLDTNLRT